jgi:predicted  nucleic acid-binding Zn-ribbon protein
VARLSEAQEQLAGAHCDLAGLQQRLQEQQQQYGQLHSSYLALEQQLQATQTMLWNNIRQLQQELQQATTEKQQLQAVRAAHMTMGHMLGPGTL